MPAARSTERSFYNYDLVIPYINGLSSNESGEKIARKTTKMLRNKKSGWMKKNWNDKVVSR